MPYKVIQKGDKFQLLNTNTNKSVKTLYKSEQSALSAGKNFSNYSHSLKMRKKTQKV